MQAALGCAQIEKLPQFILKKKKTLITFMTDLKILKNLCFQDLM